MTRGYFNFQSNLAETRWERSQFARHWWHMYADDPYWVPPYYPAFRQALEPGHNAYLAHLKAKIVYITGVVQKSRSDSGATSFPLGTGFLESLGMEHPVAAAVVLCDPRREVRKAHLAWLKAANDQESLERLMYFVRENLTELGCREIIGPTGLAPNLGSGLLLDHWDTLAPLHSAYNPPYLPELVNDLMEPAETGHLYTLEVPSTMTEPTSQPAQLTPLDPSRLAKDLLPLFRCGFPTWQQLLSPDAREATFIFWWITRLPLQAWVARIEDQPVGFILLQPNLAPIVKRAGGGRNIFWRAWLRWQSRKSVRGGDLLFGGVLPDWQGKGIGRQLLQQALWVARQQGWERLSVGPIPESADASDFLKSQGARPCHQYQIYQWG